MTWMLLCDKVCTCIPLILKNGSMPFFCLTETSWKFGMLAFAFVGLLIGAMLLVMGVMATRLVTVLCSMLCTFSSERRQTFTVYNYPPFLTKMRT